MMKFQERPEGSKCDPDVESQSYQAEGIPAEFNACEKVLRECLMHLSNSKIQKDKTSETMQKQREMGYDKKQKLFWGLHFLCFKVRVHPVCH